MIANLVIVAEDAKTGHPGIRGIGHPRNSFIWHLAMGMRKAKELMYTEDAVSGIEGARIGMINKAVPIGKPLLIQVLDHILKRNWLTVLISKPQ